MKNIVEIDECTTKLKMLSNNLMLVRLGLTNKDVIPNDEVVDNALYVIEEESVKANNVDYKSEAIKLLNNIDNESYLRKIYSFIKGLLA